MRLALVVPTLVLSNPMETMLSKRDATTYEINAVCTA